MTLDQRLRLVEAALGAVRLLFFHQRNSEDTGLVPEAHISRRLVALGDRLAVAVWVAEVGNAQEREEALQEAGAVLSELWNLDRLSIARSLLSPIIYRVKGGKTPRNEQVPRRR